MDGAERLVALDEQTGALLWTQEWPATYRNLHAKFATGPRATPAVDGDRIFVVGAAGTILCLDVRTGAVLWQVDTTAAYGATVPVYGFSASPLVDGERLIVLVGGEPDALVVAFDTGTGEEVWRALPLLSEAGYSAPLIHEVGGVRQLILWHPLGISSLDPATGEVYWQHDWEIPSGMTVATPVVNGPYLAVTHFRRGSLMLQLDQDRPGARELWRGRSRSELPGQTDGLHALITTPLIIGDYLYGVGSYGELAVPRCAHRRTPLGNRRTRGAGALGHGDLRAARGSGLRDQRKRRTDSGAAHPAGLYRDRPHDGHRTDHPHPRRRERPLGRPRRHVGPPRVRQSPHHPAQRPGDHPRLARRVRLSLARVRLCREPAVSPCPDDPSAFDEQRRGEWRWTSMIMLPDAVTDADLQAALGELSRKKKRTSAHDGLRLATLDEGRSVQLLYVGRYDDMGPAIAQLQAFAASAGYRPAGRHRDVYLSDPRRSAPEKLKTILRQPVAEAGDRNQN